MKKYNINQVGATLQYGMVFKMGQWILMYLGLILTLIALISVCGSFISELFVTETLYQFEDGLGIVFAILFCFGVHIGFAFWIVKKHMLTKKIYIWLDDAVELYARTHTISKSGHFLQLYKLKVEFKYGKKYTLYSGNPERNYYIVKNNGYFKILSESDKKVKILYSPKYNEVLFLKNEPSLS